MSQNLILWGGLVLGMLALSACAVPAPTPTPTFIPSPTPAPPTPTLGTSMKPTSAPPISGFFPAKIYVLESGREISGYTVQIWRNTKAYESEFFSFKIATISAPGQETVQIEFFSALGELTGSDITGEGNPDLIIETYSGGAHCCVSTKVFDLGPTLAKVLDTPESNCGGSFQDLDGDGIMEFVTCDDIFAYTYCPYAFSPFAPVVLQYQPGAGYLSATPRFADLYAEDIANHTELAENAEDFGEWDGTNKCSVLPLILDYLYTGQSDKAWEAVYRYYTYPDVEDFRQEIEETISKSPPYTSQ